MFLCIVLVFTAVYICFQIALTYFLCLIFCYLSFSPGYPKLCHTHYLKVTVTSAVLILSNSDVMLAAAGKASSLFTSSSCGFTADQTQQTHIAAPQHVINRSLKEPPLPNTAFHFKMKYRHFFFLLARDLIKSQGRCAVSLLEGLQQ